MADLNKKSSPDFALWEFLDQSVVYYDFKAGKVCTESKTKDGSNAVLGISYQYRHPDFSYISGEVVEILESGKGLKFWGFNDSNDDLEAVAIYDGNREFVLDSGKKESFRLNIERNHYNVIVEVIIEVFDQDGKIIFEVEIKGR